MTNEGNLKSNDARRSGDRDDGAFDAPRKLVFDAFTSPNWSAVAARPSRMVHAGSARST